jgi:Protein of unknown function (DUF2934)
MSTTEKPKAAKAPAKAPTKAPAKPRKTAAKAKVPAAALAIAVPTHQEIALLAEKYWAERGWQDGAAEQDWLRAEQELMKIAS